uniref:ETS transcription factor ELK4 n=1 Tax=Sus scrofa TaxID=9823 RepID=A0A8D0QEM0_PIG
MPIPAPRPPKPGKGAGAAGSAPLQPAPPFPPPEVTRGGSGVREGPRRYSGGFESGGGRGATGKPGSGENAPSARPASSGLDDPRRRRVRGRGGRGARRRGGCGGGYRRCGRLRTPGGLCSAAAAFSGSAARVAAAAAPSSSSQREEEAAGGEEHRVRGGDSEGATRAASNIIKKVNGQKFVYKFVSYPEILSMDPMTVGRVEGDCEALGIAELSSNSSRDVENGGKEKPLQPGAKTSSRNDYIHSGLYSSFTLNSLNSSSRKLFKSIKVENPAEKLAEKKSPQEPTPSVIKFVTTPSKKPPVEPFAATISTGPSISPSSEETIQALETLASPKLSSLEAPTSASSVTAAFTTAPPSLSGSPLQEAPGTPSPPLSSNPDMDTDMESVASQPVELSENLSLEPKDQDSALPEKDKTNNSSRSKKPKGLELAPTLVITGSDPSPLGILSPSLPTASLTPALFSQTPILLTPSPLLSSIHFWSTLSPVAPLSPARLQGANTLFQFPSVLNSHGPFTLSGLDGPSTPGPFSPDLQKT